MSTVHIYFTGGPMDGTITSFEDPGDLIEFPIAEGPDWIEYARYGKLRSEKAHKSQNAMRGEQGLWVYRGMRIDEKPETIETLHKETK